MKKASLHIEGRKVVVHRRLCRVAEVDGEGYKYLADPKAVIAEL